MSSSCLARRLSALAFGLLIALAWQRPAQASNDGGCSLSWTLVHDTRSECNNMAMLAPANDTRVNLVLLLGDLHTRTNAALAASAEEGGGDDPLFDWSDLKARLFPSPGESFHRDYAWGEGSKCRSNDSGTEGFKAAVNSTAAVAAPERAVLIGARMAIAPPCTLSRTANQVRSAWENAFGAYILANQVRSASGNAFLTYIEGAQAFYAGDFATASARFAALVEADVPWLRETARYMLGRTEVNRMQVHAFDDYGSPKGAEAIAPTLVGGAAAALGDYLRAYPEGAYAKSAHGLLRRVYWLGGARGNLVAEYVALLALDGLARGLDDGVLADEIDNKLLPGLTASDTSDPILLAVMDLARMRAPKKGEKDARITLAELEAQRPAFGANPALFDHLLAVHAFYVQKQPRAVLGLIPDAARQSSFTALQFSRQMLRGMALEAVKDRNARGFWLDMATGATAPFQRPALELAIAMHEERAGRPDKVFAAGSPVRNQAIREILLANVADAALLRKQAKAADAAAHERDLALFTLLYKEATRGRHADFSRDLALVPADAPAKPTDGYFERPPDHVPLGVFSQPGAGGDYDCPSFKETQVRLARTPLDTKALLCLADFIRLSGFDGLFLDKQPPKDQLGGARTHFSGEPYSRLDTYKAIIANPKVSAADKAYALYRAVNCYAPNGNNNCGGTGAPINERRAWFRRLKQSYPSSRWAKELTYYW